MITIESPPKFLRELIAEFLDTVDAAPASVVAYEHDLTSGADLLEGALGRPPSAADLTVGSLRLLFLAFRDAHGQDATIRAWSSWHRFTITLARQGVLPYGSPMGAVPRTPTRARPPGALTDHQVDVLLTTLATGGNAGRRKWPIRDQALIVTELACGLRPAEVVGLDVDHLGGEPGARTIHVISPEPVHNRWMEIPDHVEVVIEAYLIDRWRRFADPLPLRRTPWDAPPGTPFWLGDDGSRLTTDKMAVVVSRSLRAAGIDQLKQTATNTLRFTCAAALLRAGTDPVDVADFLGYVSLASLEPYLQDPQSAPAGSAPPRVSAHLQQTIDS